MSAAWSALLASSASKGFRNVRTMTRSASLIGAPRERVRHRTVWIVPARHHPAKAGRHSLNEAAGAPSSGLAVRGTTLHDLTGQCDARVADVHPRAGDQFFDLEIAFAAERAR